MTKSDSFQRYNCAKKVAALKLMVNSWSAFWLLCILLLNTAATDAQIGRFGCFWVVLFQFWALVTAHNTHPRNRLNWTRSERKRDRSSFTLNNDQSSCVWIFHWTPHVTHSPSNNRMSERNSRYSPVAFRLRDQRSWKLFSPFFSFCLVCMTYVHWVPKHQNYDRRGEGKTAVDARLWTWWQRQVLGAWT